MKKRVLRKYINIILIIVLMGSLSSPGFVHAAGNDDQGAGTPAFCEKNPTHKSCAAYQDKTPPSAPTLNLSPNVTDWTKENVTFTLTPGEDNTGGSGVDKTEYKFGNDDAWQSYSGQAVNVPGEGTITIYARTVDKAGNNSTEVTKVVKKDTTAPSNPALTASPNVWTNQEKVTVTLSPGTDNLSGVLKSQYKVGNGTWTDYSNPIDITSEGTTTILGRTIDKAGNISVESQTVAKIDRTGPSTPVIEPSTSNWTNQDVTFTITPGTDSGSGVQKTEYKIGTDNEDWYLYNPGTSVTVTNQGETQIFARTLDNLNNPSKEANATVKIDRSASSRPTIELSPSTWTNGTVTFEIKNGEKTSGSSVVKSVYKLNDDVNWIDYEAPVVINQEGVTTITALTVDEAGNESPETIAQAKIDSTKPSVPTIEPSTTGWTKGNVTVTISPGIDEENGSGVKEAQYSFDGETWTKYENVVTIKTEGITKIFARTADNAGNFSDSVDITVQIDKTAPTEPGISSDHTGWTKDNVVVTLTDGKDTGSGYKHTQYKIGDGDWQTYTGEITFNEAGEYKVYARSVDNAENTSEAVSIDVKIDRTGPSQPTINANTDWTNDSVTISILDGEDTDSGIMRTEYRFSESEEWTTYNTSFLVIDEGVTTIYARSIDNVGNVGVERKVEVKIDRTAPDEPYIHLSKTGWSNEPVTFTIENINDALSGVKQVMYQIGNDGEWVVYNKGDIIKVDKEGVTPIHVKVVDNAGNESSADGDVEIDITAPTAPVIEKSSGTAEWSNKNVTVSITGGEDFPVANEKVSGVKQTEYQLEGSEEWFLYTDPIEISDEGTTTIKARTLDKAGNESTVSVETVKIDKTNPTTPTIGLNKEGWTNQDVTITVTPVIDELSGLAKTEYKIEDGQWTEYKGSFTFNQEGDNTIFARTVDNAGNISENGTANVKIDKSNPEISVNGNKPVYQVDELIQITCAASDSLSGIASTNCQNINGYGYELGLGDHVYTFEATDIAGNTTSRTVDFKVEVTYSSLKNLTSKFVSKPEIAHSLIVKLEQAEASLARGNVKTANNQKNAFKNEVLAQRGKALTVENATTLLKLLENL